MGPYFNLFIRLLSAFLLFSVKMQKQKNKQTNKNQTGSNCAIIGCNLSKKHKLALYKTQNGEPNYVARS